MPPRIPVAQCLRAQSAPSRAFSSSCRSQASTVAQRRKHRDPYAIAQANARKAANLSRQEVLRVERAGQLGDPVRGTTTAFVQSFDTALPPPATTGDSDINMDHDNRLNFYLSKTELDQAVARSKWLTHPLPDENHGSPSSSSPPSDLDVSTSDSSSSSSGSLPTEVSSSLLDLMNSFPAESDAKRKEWQDSTRNILRDLSPEERQSILAEEHDTAQEALRRISSLALGSSADRLRINKQRCIDVFGRHNTDQTLPPKPIAAHSNQLEKGERVGPDTGSSEVQVAILTAKIRALADFLETRGTTDKHGKRDLRLLVHRRAKLLKYLRRKERGGPRWQNLVETLGLTEGTWKGEITL